MAYANLANNGTSTFTKPTYPLVSISINLTGTSMSENQCSLCPSLPPASMISFSHPRPKPNRTSPPDKYNKNMPSLMEPHWMAPLISHMQMKRPKATHDGPRTVHCTNPLWLQHGTLQRSKDTMPSLTSLVHNVPIQWWRMTSHSKTTLLCTHPKVHVPLKLHKTRHLLRSPRTHPVLCPITVQSTLKPPSGLLRYLQGTHGRGTTYGTPTLSLRPSQILTGQFVGEHPHCPLSCPSLIVSQVMCPWTSHRYSIADLKTGGVYLCSIFCAWWVLYKRHSSKGCAIPISFTHFVFRLLHSKRPSQLLAIMIIPTVVVHCINMRRVTQWLCLSMCFKVLDLDLHECIFYGNITSIATHTQYSQLTLGACVIFRAITCHVKWHGSGYSELTGWWVDKSVV